MRINILRKLTNRNIVLSVSTQSQIDSDQYTGVSRVCLAEYESNETFL